MSYQFPQNVAWQTISGGYFWLGGNFNLDIQDGRLLSAILKITKMPDERPNWAYVTEALVRQIPGLSLS